MISVARGSGIFAVGMALWIGVDLYRPVHNDLRQFDPVALGRAETAMWRSYYAHQRLQLFYELTGMLQTQYGMPFWRSVVTAFHAAKGAAVFQRGDFQAALPDLIDYYNLILKSSRSRFRPEQAAKLELDWWIIHRQRDSHDPVDLPKSLAVLQAEIYGLPPGRFIDHANQRAKATRLCDAHGDWKLIEELLIASWSSLHREVNL